MLLIRIDPSFVERDQYNVVFFTVYVFVAVSSFNHAHVHLFVHTLDYKYHVQHFAVIKGRRGAVGCTSDS